MIFLPGHCVAREVLQSGGDLLGGLVVDRLEELENLEEIVGVDDQLDLEQIVLAVLVWRRRRCL